MSEGTKPVINVTPLIDVLLVLLIIFMVAAPLKPHRFETQLPAPPQNTPDVHPNPWTLVVSIQPDRTLMLNSSPESVVAFRDHLTFIGRVMSPKHREIGLLLLQRSRENDVMLAGK